MIRFFLQPKRIITTITACGIALTIATGTTFAATDQGPASMILKTAKVKKPATFPHALHQKSLACETCHHGKDEAGKQRPLLAEEAKAKCVTCHNSTMANKKINSFKKAAHARCKTCHKTMKKAGQKTGPTKCNGCHITKK